MINDLGEEAPVLGPSKTWTLGNRKIMHYRHRLWNRWGFQIGGYGADADNPFKAAFSAWKFKRKREAEIKARHNR